MTVVTPSPRTVSLQTARGRWVLLATVLGTGVAFLDATVVNVALPTIGRDLHVGLADLQWTVTAYTLTLSAFLLLGGSLGDRYGRRRVFVVGLVWFALASLLCGAAPSAGVLIAARAVQGVGGALLTPASLAIIEATFRPEDRGAAIGAWSGLGGIFGALGPIAGGVLVAAASWRLVFLVNLPVAALAIAVTLRHVPESAAPGERARLDVVGPVLAVGGLGCVTYGLIEGAALGFGSAAVIATLVTGPVLLAVLLAVESRQAAPMLPLDVFRSLEFSGTNAATFAIYAALGVVTFLVVIEVQAVMGYSPTQAGAVLLPVTLLLLALSSRSGRLAGRIGARLPMTVGPLAAAVGMALFARAGPGAHYLTTLLPAAVVFGLGLVLTVPALTTTALGAVDSGRAGIASAINNDVARVGGLTAIAVVPLLAGIRTSGSQVDTAAFGSGFRTAMLIAAGLCALGAPIAFATVGRPARAVARAHHHSCPISGPWAPE